MCGSASSPAGGGESWRGAAPAAPCEGESALSSGMRSGGARASREQGRARRQARGAQGLLCAYVW